MKYIGRTFSYANVVATIALFLALSGGVVYAASTLGKNAVKSTNIAANAVKTRNLAKNAVKTKSLAANSVITAKIKKEAVTSSKVKKASLNRTDLATGTLAGLQVAEVSAAAVPSLTGGTPGGAPIPLTGTAAFTPIAGKSYELLVELRGNPVDAGGGCFDFVSILANGVPLTGVSISAEEGGTPPFAYQPVGTSATAIALQAVGQPQTLSALSFGSTSCAPGTTASLKAVVVQLN